MGKGNDIWIERHLIKSKAFQSLSSTALKVLMIFFTKRQFGYIGRKGKKRWEIINNGEIVFTYIEAKRKYGISYSAFRNAIDELISKGFIDIAASGQGTYRATNLYAISNRWRSYGTPDYEPPQPRHKKPINRGFQKGNRFGRNCGRKKKSTVAEQHSSTVAHQHSKEK